MKHDNIYEDHITLLLNPELATRA